MLTFEFNWKGRMETIKSQAFACQHRMKSTHFTRKRCLSFSTVITYLLKMAKKSLQIECNLLADLLNNEPVTKQAMSKARTKISVSAFQELHSDMIKDHYEDNPYHLWKGYRIFGGDGSTLHLPKEKKITDIFGNYFKNTALARIFQYVEITTDTVVLPMISPYDISEDQMAKIMLPELVRKMNLYGQKLQLYVYDRGLPSYEFAQQHIDLKVDFLFRLPQRFNPKVDEIINKQEEADFEIDVDRKDAKYRARIIIRYLSSKQPLILLTSLTDKNFKAEDIVEAYRMRWRCEESYKFQKFLLQTENYSGKTVQAILQDYWSGVFIATAMNLFFLEKEEEICKENEEEKKRKINKSVVYGAMQADLLQALLEGDTSDKIFRKLDKLCRLYRVPIRPNRSYPRLSNDTRRGRHIYRKCI